MHFLSKKNLTLDKNVIHRRALINQKNRYLRVLVILKFLKNGYNIFLHASLKKVHK